MLATAAYLIGVFGVTVVGNVPLNDMLDKFDISNSTAESVKQMRESFENRWNLLNNIRTVFSIISIVLVICACIWNKQLHG
ncbi:anthrone oxygenase family protein [Chryseobacterium sp. DT-3]|uniref:anthrone oxygenase family protein n=1 Tax=Chryseobacterium sp. DT-3 TaxID=3396164 RepID=UPI003F1D7617